MSSLNEVEYPALIWQHVISSPKRSFLARELSLVASQISTYCLSYNSFRHLNQHPHTHTADMDLLVEIWTQAFENIRLNDLRARHRYVQAYCNAIKANRHAASFLIATSRDQDSRERNAYAQLPAFERQAWKATRQYYKVDQNSRAAAIQLSLSSSLLSTCSVLLTRFHTDFCSPSAFEQDHTAVFELFNSMDFERRVKQLRQVDDLFKYNERPLGFVHKHALTKSCCGQFAELTYGDDIYGCSKEIWKVVVLVAPSVGGIDVTARECMDRFVGCVVGRWKRLRGEGEVECWD